VTDKITLLVYADTEHLHAVIRGYLVTFQLRRSRTSILIMYQISHFLRSWISTTRDVSRLEFNRLPTFYF